MVDLRKPDGKEAAISLIAASFVIQLQNSRSGEVQSEEARLLNNAIIS